jgi:hypothetical protein
MDAEATIGALSVALKESSLVQETKGRQLRKKTANKSNWFFIKFNFWLGLSNMGRQIYYFI